MKKCTGLALGAAVLACAAGMSVAQVRVGSAGAGTAKAGGVQKEINVVSYLVGDRSGDGGTSAASTYLWDNGDDDRVAAILSTVNSHVDAQAADDCWLKEGMFYDVQYATVRMAITNGFSPDPVANPVNLYVYEDCDGRPDDSVAPLVYDMYSASMIDPNPGGDFAGTSVWEITFYIDRFVQGEDLRWLSPVYRGEGLAFWLTANNGKVQGRQGQYKAPAFGFPTWDDADNELCCGICTDFYLKIDGKCCWRVLAQSNFDLDGLTNPIYAQNHPWTRTLDDFQLADPCKEVEEWGICRIEAYFATNCDLTTIYGEIFNNECDMPVDLTQAPHRLTPTDIEDLGLTVAGLPVYKVTFWCPPDTLDDGCNYWFSIFSEQGAFLGKRSIWLYQQREACNIRLNEGKFFYPAIGIDPATPVSALPLGPGVPRGFAYSVWVCKPH
ncbi:MAG: hypothetical protein R3B49_02630 [Phycisphaerales bacterium]